MKATIYHNPRCTKSRQTLALLQEHEVETKVIEYLQEPPTKKTLRELLRKLGISAHQLIRRKEYLALELPETDDEARLIQAMADHPEIIERPIVVVGREARLGRPPENVLDLLS